MATHVKTFDFVVSTNVFEGSGFSHFGEAEKITYNENKISVLVIFGLKHKIVCRVELMNSMKSVP